MSEQKIETPSATGDQAMTPEPNASNQTDSPNRRELIARYGKYAVVATPLLLFASKAHAIHSKP